MITVHITQPPKPCQYLTVFFFVCEMSLNPAIFIHDGRIFQGLVEKK